MSRETKAELWVVYKMTVWGKLPGSNAVCQQGEWDEMERGQPGHHELIREGIANESEAEQLARESPGGTKEPVQLKKRLLIGTRV